MSKENRPGQFNNIPDNLEEVRQMRGEAEEVLGELKATIPDLEVYIEQLAEQEARLQAEADLPE